MTKLKKLFQKAWTAVTNPGQDERVSTIVAAIGNGIQTQRAAFDLEKILEPIECTEVDVQVATKQYYNKLLQRYWSKEIPDAGKQKTLVFVGKKLLLKDADVRKANTEAAVVYFGARLGEYLSDGVLSDDELAVLSQVASFLGLTVPEFVQQNLASQGIGLLRGLFADAISSGVLEKPTWYNLLESAQKLGITIQQFQNAATPLAVSFAEHILADTKSDGFLSGEEEEYLHWLMKTFHFVPSFQEYLTKEIALLRERTRIANGNLDTVAIPAGVNLNAGELLYFARVCTLRIVKQLKTGNRTDDHEGRLFLTDIRLIFDSATKTIRIPFRAIVVWNASNDRIRVSVANKPELSFYFPPSTESLLAEKFSMLIQLHSQVLRKKVEGAVDRHIPRDIRQRVWQRYGGKCAECAARDYLEFDHIVPVARGGSNSELNVQLLCRRCNSQKSDKI